MLPSASAFHNNPSFAGTGAALASVVPTNIAARTIGRGLKEPGAPPPVEPGRVRRPGGGRKALGSIDPKLLEDRNALVEPDANAEIG
jgi:hypothetical protein